MVIGDAIFTCEFDDDKFALLALLRFMLKKMRLWLFWIKSVNQHWVIVTTWVPEWFVSAQECQFWICWRRFIWGTWRCLIMWTAIIKTRMNEGGGIGVGSLKPGCVGCGGDREWWRQHFNFPREEICFKKRRQSQRWIQDFWQRGLWWQVWVGVIDWLTGLVEWSEGKKFIFFNTTTKLKYFLV